MDKIRVTLGIFVTALSLTSGLSFAQNSSQERLNNCVRDLGNGVSLQANPVYSIEGNLTAATLLFRYWDGELAITPSKLSLRGLPVGTIFKPNKVHVEVHKPTVSGTGTGYSQSLHISFPQKVGTH